MITLAIITKDPAVEAQIEQIAQESGVFEVVVRLAPLPAWPELHRILSTHRPEVVLVDASDWQEMSVRMNQIRSLGLKMTLVAFASRWAPADQYALEKAGISDFLTAPFNPTQLEACVFDVLHRAQPISHPNVLAFLPSKAGSGASTVALNTAAALANGPDGSKRVLLFEADRRSGVFSILLNLEDHDGLPEAIRRAGAMTPLEWNHSIVKVSGVDLLPAKPTRRGPLPTWADYYQLLTYASDLYDYIVVDLPEVINPATAELVRSARVTFITCTPELPSLAMAQLRLGELDACEIPRSKVKALVNRYERGGLSMQEMEAILDGPVFATLPNDYKEVKKSILESRLVSSSSGFGKSCAALAQKITELGQVASTNTSVSRFALLRKLSALTGV